MPLYINKRPSLRHNGVRYARNASVELSLAVAAQLLASGAIEPADAATDADTMLVGSSELPSTFALADGGELALGDVVRTAFDASGLSVDAWNALEDNTRDRQILAHALLAGAVSPGEQRDPIQPSAEGADGLSVDDAGAGAPAPASETDSTTEAQTDDAASETPPSGEAPGESDTAAPAQEPSGDGDASPEAPAAKPAPKDSKPPKAPKSAKQGK